MPTITCPGCGVERPENDYRPVKPSLIIPPEPGEVRYAIVAEAPGEVEHLKGQPMVGDSGKLLRSVLCQAGFDDKSMLFTNVCCCRPDKNATPTTGQLQTGRLRLMKELYDFKPDRILSLGNVAASALFQTPLAKTKITKLRGKWKHIILTNPDDQEEKRFVPILPTLHPALLLRSPDEFRDFTLDIRRLAKPISQSFHPKAIYPDTLEDAWQALDQLISYLEVTKIGAVDIETTSKYPHDGRILTIGISPTEDLSYIFGDHLLSSQALLARLQQLFYMEGVQWVGHNALAFDAPYMKRALGLDVPIALDTMVAHYVVDERGAVHSLKKLGNTYFGLDDWSEGLDKYLKEEDGATYESIPRDTLVEYQAMDTAVTYALVDELVTELVKDHVDLTYRNILHPAAEMLGEIRMYGVRIDEDYLEKLGERLRSECAELEQKIATISGMQLNVRSTKQLVEMFDNLGLNLDAIPKTDKGNYSLNSDVLEALSEALGKDVDAGNILEVINALLEYRAVAKLESTYVRGIQKKIVDGRIYPDLLIHGTRTGRLASRNPNIQNIPKHRGPEIRHAFVPTPGYRFVEADYSQLEYRVACHLSGDPGLEAAFNSGEDFHRAVAATIFHKRPSEVTKLERHSAKFVNFGIMYGREAPSLAVGELRPLVLDVEAWENAKSRAERFKLEQDALKRAEKFRSDFLARFPLMDAWFKEQESMVRSHGYVKSPTGRKRRFPLILPRNYGDLKREARNMPIQSLASDICLTSGVRIHRHFQSGDVRVLFFVHDSIMMEIREDLLPSDQEVMTIDLIKDEAERNRQKREMHLKYPTLQRIYQIMENSDLVKDANISFPIEMDIMTRWARADKDD